MCHVPFVYCLCSFIDGFSISWLVTKLLCLCVFCFLQGQYVQEETVYQERGQEKQLGSSTLRNKGHHESSLNIIFTLEASMNKWIQKQFITESWKIKAIMSIYIHMAWQSVLEQDTYLLFSHSSRVAQETSNTYTDTHIHSASQTYGPLCTLCAYCCPA